MNTSPSDEFIQLVQVAMQENPDGSRRFANEDVLHFLPWVMVNMGVDAASLDDDALALFSTACANAGVVRDDDTQVISGKLDDYYRQHPPNRDLVTAFEAAYRQVNQGAAMQENPFARLSGEKPAIGVLGGTGPRPAGTVAGGPMARFRASVKK